MHWLDLPNCLNSLLSWIGTPLPLGTPVQRGIAELSVIGSVHLGIGLFT
jgi:hypothetical protein